MIKHSNKEEQVVEWCLFTSPSNSHSSIVFPSHVCLFVTAFVTAFLGNGDI